MRRGVAKDVWDRDEDEHVRKRREPITETTQRRLRKKRTREGGTKSGLATEADEPDDL